MKIKTKTCCWIVPIILSTSVLAVEGPLTQGTQEGVQRSPARIAVQHETSITNGAFQGGHGRIAVNQAAGDHNLQTNTHVIGASATLENEQEVSSKINPDEHEQVLTSSTIDNHAFNGARGMISINQVAGSGNIQANLGLIALSTPAQYALSDTDLGSVSGTELLALPTTQDGQHSVEIASDTFINAQGIIQINQISGDSNVTTNQFSLQFPGGN